MQQGAVKSNQTISSGKGNLAIQKFHTGIVHLFLFTVSPPKKQCLKKQRYNLSNNLNY